MYNKSGSKHRGLLANKAALGLEDKATAAPRRQSLVDKVMDKALGLEETRDVTDELGLDDRVILHQLGVEKPLPPLMQKQLENTPDLPPALVMKMSAAFIAAKDDDDELSPMTSAMKAAEIYCTPQNGAGGRNVSVAGGPRKVSIAGATIAGAPRKVSIAGATIAGAPRKVSIAGGPPRKVSIAAGQRKVSISMQQQSPPRYPARARGLPFDTGKQRRSSHLQMKMANNVGATLGALFVTPGVGTEGRASFCSRNSVR
eukprot:4748596-Prymnesium_polylepis.1